METVARFWFDRPVRPDHEDGAWVKAYWPEVSWPDPGEDDEAMAALTDNGKHEIVGYDPLGVGRQVAWLFGNLPKLRQTFSEAQLVQGFNGLGDPRMWGMTAQWISEPDVPVADKVAVFDAVAKFYDDAGGTALPAAGWGWLEAMWPLLVEPDRDAVLNAMLGCLERLLDSHDRTAVGVALDMFGHLRDEEPAKALMARRGYTFNPDNKRYGGWWVPPGGPPDNPIAWHGPP